MSRSSVRIRQVAPHGQRFRCPPARWTRLDSGPTQSQTRAPVAQLDRAFDYESKGREFESLRARHFIRSIAQLGSAPALGAGGRGFKSRCSDQTSGGIAQLGEHLPCKQGVVGSNPVTSTMMFLDSSAVEHPAVNRRVAGSNPARGANAAPIAQSVERIHGKDEVTSSSLVGSSMAPWSSG